MKKLMKPILLFFGIAIFVSCSSSDDGETIPTDTRSFTTDANTDFFINSDGTVDLTVTGEFKDGDLFFGSVVDRGFVYGTTSKPTVSTTNVANVDGASTAASGYIRNLDFGQNYFIRGYLKMDDGSYFYGNEIQASTDVDASTTRTITLEMEPDPFFISQTEVTPQLKLSNVAKELPMEIGYEYSLNSDFSNSTIKAIDDYSGAHNQGVILITSYASEVISGLTAATTYYFRPYAKYKDDTVTNGGDSTVSFTTNN